MARYRAGGDTSAAGGRKSELSEWQRSIADEGFSKPRKRSGTATGWGNDDFHGTVHEMSASTAGRLNNYLIFLG